MSNQPILTLEELALRNRIIPPLGHITIFDAVEALGIALYGSEWRGDERRCVMPPNLQNKYRVNSAYDINYERAYNIEVRTLLEKDDRYSKLLKDPTTNLKYPKMISSHDRNAAKLIEDNARKSVWENSERVRALGNELQKMKARRHHVEKLCIQVLWSPSIVEPPACKSHFLNKASYQMDFPANLWETKEGRGVIRSEYPGFYPKYPSPFNEGAADGEEYLLIVLESEWSAVVAELKKQRTIEHTSTRRSRVSPVKEVTFKFLDEEFPAERYSNRTEIRLDAKVLLHKLGEKVAIDAVPAKDYFNKLLTEWRKAPR